MKLSLYQFLGVTETATVEEIRAGFKRMAIKYHPDKNPDDPIAQAVFPTINRAHEILSDPEQRERYDAARKNPATRPAPSVPTGDDDFSKAVKEVSKAVLHNSLDGAINALFDTFPSFTGGKS